MTKYWISGEKSVEITHAEDNNVVLCEGQIKIASLSASTFRPKPMPAAISMEILGER